MASKSFLDNLTPTQRIAAGAVFLIVGAGSAFLRLRQEPQPAPAPQPGDAPQTLANRNVRFGMPADAKHDPASKDAYLIDRPQYVLSYNDSKRIPNWVCWNLNKSDIGDATRAAFKSDPDLPAAFYHVRNDDYALTGFDKGHMCASKDRSATDPDNDITFYLTNVVPQAPNNNQKGWRLLEDHCRKIAEKGNEVYIACGPHGQGGIGSKDAAKHLTIGKAHPIVVPETVWKVVLVLPNKDAVPNAQSQTIAVWMPNDQTVGPDWQKYTVSVATVEQRTGYKFFPLVPDDVAKTIKDRAP